MQTYRPYLALTKPRIVGLLLVTTLPVMFLAQSHLSETQESASGSVPSLSLILATLIGGTLAAMGANVANMVLDRDIDKIMERTSNRPIPQGMISPRSATVFSVVLLATALAVFLIWVNVLSAALSLGAAAFYILIYTLWLKRRSVENIVIGGAAGAVPPLVGWAAVTGSLAWSPFWLFMLVFFWTPPHFWALAVKYKQDYGAAKVPMLPVVAPLHRVARRIMIYVFIVVTLSFVVGRVADLSALYFLLVGLLGVGFVTVSVSFFIHAFEAFKAGSPSSNGVGSMHMIFARFFKPSEFAMRIFYYSMIYLFGLFGVITIDVLLIS